QEGLYFVGVLSGYVDVVLTVFHPDAQLPELVGDDAQMVDARMADREFASRHGRHADERADFDHIRKDAMLTALQGRDTFYGEQVRAYAMYMGTHAVQHAAKLLHVRLTGGIVNGGGAPGQ